MNDRSLTVSADTAIRLENLARRLGLPLEQALAQIAGRMDVMDRIAAMLAVEITPSPAPLRLRPAETISEEIAAIQVRGNEIATRLPHADDRFAAVVKGLSYRWDGQFWTRIIRKFAEPVSDRAVELGVRLLAAGFPVEVRSAELHRRIAASEYTPETETWVTQRTAGKFAGWFAVQWERDGRDYFRPVSLIRGARCYPGTALVPPHCYDEVLDFAQLHGFAVSDGALDLAAKAKRERAAMLLVTPVVREPERPAPADNNDLASGEILDELADEPL
jgi:hypothetical protein